MVLGKLPAIFVGAGFTNNLSFTSTIFINPPSSYIIFICKNSHLAPSSRTGFPASQKFNFLVGSRGWPGDPALKGWLRMVQDVSNNWDVAPFSISFLWTGKMPVPQRVNFLASQASCLFLRMVQDVSNNLLTIARSSKKPLSLTITTLRTLSGFPYRRLFPVSTKFCDEEREI